MKCSFSIGCFASWTAAALMIASPSLTAASEPLAAPTAATAAAQPFAVADVALGEGGVLAGQAISVQGSPIADEKVSINDGRQQWTTTTDGDGRFRFEGLRGGQYRIQAGEQVRFCRAWTPGTAPPSANKGLMIVQGQQTILGQYCGSPVGCGSPVAGGMAGCKQLLSNPLVIGGIIAAAIAIPVAIHNADDDDDDSAS